MKCLQPPRSDGPVAELSSSAYSRVALVYPNILYFRVLSSSNVNSRQVTQLYLLLRGCATSGTRSRGQNQVYHVTRSFTAYFYFPLKTTSLCFPSSGVSDLENNGDG